MLNYRTFPATSAGEALALQFMGRVNGRIEFYASRIIVSFIGGSAC